MRLNDFGPRFKQLRLAQGITQTQMGRLLNLHYLHIGRYEAGKALPAVETLAMMSQKLKVTCDYLVFGDRVQTELKDEELLYLFKEILALAPADRIDAKKLLGDFVADRRRFCDKVDADN